MRFNVKVFIPAMELDLFQGCIMMAHQKLVNTRKGLLLVKMIYHQGHPVGIAARASDQVRPTGMQIRGQIASWLNLVTGGYILKKSVVNVFNFECRYFFLPRCKLPDPES